MNEEVHDETRDEAIRAAERVAGCPLMRADGLRGARAIALTVHGSHLHGTANESSDFDLKGVFIPAAEDILLQRAPKTVREGTADTRSPSSPGDIEVEWLSLDRFLSMLAAGQPNAVEMLFAPHRFHLFEPRHPWDNVRNASRKLIPRHLTRIAHSFRRQADASGRRGPRAETAEAVRAALEAEVRERGRDVRLAEALPRLEELAAHHDGVRMEGAGRNTPATFRVHDRATQLTQSLGEALDNAARLERSYGRRSRTSADAGGTDPKALSHALRISEELLELVRTDRVFFPKPDADRLAAIKRGEFTDPAAIVAEIDANIDAMADAAAKYSPLANEPDAELRRSLVLRAHADAVAGFDAPRH